MFRQRSLPVLPIWLGEGERVGEGEGEGDEGPVCCYRALASCFMMVYHSTVIFLACMVSVNTSQRRCVRQPRDFCDGQKLDLTVAGIGTARYGEQASKEQASKEQAFREQASKGGQPLCWPTS